MKLPQSFGMDSTLSVAALPLYSPYAPSPGYSQDPTDDETRLNLSPSIGARLPPTGLFTKVCGPVTVIILDQEDDVRAPSYGRRATVRGTLNLAQDTSRISEVVAKVCAPLHPSSHHLMVSLELEGRLEITTVDSGAVTKLVKHVHSLWSRGSASSPCPGTIEFAFSFPPTFKHQGSEYSLPPSYVAKFPGFASLFVTCTYSLTISMTKDGRFLSKSKLYVKLPSPGGI